MADNVADRVVVEIIAKTSELDSKVKASATEFSTAMKKIENAGTRAESSVTRSTGQMAQSSRNLGYQISDIGTQLAGGQNPFLILAQQAPQVANALEGATGAAGRMAAFFSGPWGAALLAAGSLLGVLISNSLLAADAQDKHRKATDDLKAAIDRLNQSAAIENHLTRQGIQDDIDKAASAQARARATLQVAQANLIEANQRSVDPTLAGEGGFNPGAVAAGNYASQVEELSARIKDLEKPIRVGQVKLAMRDVAAATDAATAATQRYEDRIDRLSRLREKVGRGSISQATFEREALAAKQREQAEIAAAHATEHHTRATQAHTRVSHENADAARAEATALKELQSAFDGLVAAYDPGLAALIRYRRELEEIDKLVAAQKIGPDEADKFRAGAQKQLTKTSADAFHLDYLDQGIVNRDYQDAATEASDKEAAANKQRLDDELQRHREGQVRTLAALYEDLFTGGTQRLWDDFKQIGLRIIAEVIAKMAIARLFGGASASEGGDFLSTLKSVASSAFSGGRASGGDVEAGRLYRVNENGGGGAVEGFRPSGSGTIIPLGSMPAAMQGGGTVVQQFFTLDARGGITTPQLLEHVNQVASRQATQAGQISYRAAVAATPGQLQRQDTLGN